MHGRGWAGKAALLRGAERAPLISAQAGVGEQAGLDADALNAVIRSVDVSGDGQLQQNELLALLSSPPPPDASACPHLVLNFDLKQVTSQSVVSCP